jgi:DNA primase
MSVKERIALLLSIKEKGKLVEFDHIYEKVSRDVKFLEKRDVSKDEIISNLKSLEEEGLIKNVNGKYAPEDKIHDYISNLISQKEKVLNRSYILVWKAKHYYPIVSNLILPYLKDRPTSVVKVFSGKNNPIEEIDPIFVRYAKYKPIPQHIIINSSDKLMEYVHNHCIDFIPYVHKLNANEPDLFVLDLDAGKKIIEKESGFTFLKYITKELYDMLIEFEINPMIKFSGSRGFQIWAKFDNSKFKSKEDLFAQYRRLAIKIQNLLEKRLQEKRKILEEEFPEFKELKQFTTSQVAHKEERKDKVLVDWSSMKPQGDVRAPFSVHYKTGLVSVPLFKEEIDEFSVLEAEPMNLIKKIKEGKRFPELVLSDPTKILKILA